MDNLLFSVFSQGVFLKGTCTIHVNDKNYFQSVASLTNIFYYDLNIYEKDDIKTFSIYDCLDQINFLKKLKKPIYIGGGIRHKNAKVVINNARPTD